MEQQKPVELNTVKCDLCGNALCPKCNKLINYLKWTLCSVCYETYNKKHLTNVKRIKDKRKVRNEKDKFKEEFTITFGNGLLFKALIQYLNESFDIICAEATPKSLEFKGMDPGRISFVIIKFNLENLVEHKLNFQKHNIFFSSCDLFATIENFNKQGSISLNRKKGTQDLEIKFGNHRFVQEYSKIDEDNIPMQNIFKLVYDNAYTIKVPELLDVLENAKNRDEIITISIELNQIRFHNGPKKGLRYEYEDGTITNVLPDSFKSQGYYEVTVNLFFLYHLTKILGPFIVNDIVLYIKHDNPLRVDVDLEGGHKIVLFVAPRVKGDLWDEEGDEFL